jgi:hypothetical protein
MGKKEPERIEVIHGCLVEADNGKLTHYYTATRHIIESEEKLLEPCDPEVKKLEDKILELLQKISEINKDYKFYYGWAAE